MEEINEQVYENAYIYLITVVEKQSSRYGMKYVGKSNGNNKNYITGGKIVNRIIKKYGTGSIDKQIIIKQPMTDNQMNELEIFYINYFNTYNNGLNLTSGGEGKSGYTPTEETRKKLSFANKGKTNSEETRKKLSFSNKGKTKSEDTRKKLSQSHKDDTVFTFSHPIYGIEICDRHTLIEKYNISKYIYDICIGKRKTYKGWSIINL